MAAVAAAAISMVAGAGPAATVTSRPATPAFTSGHAIVGATGGTTGGTSGTNAPAGPFSTAALTVRPVGDGPLPANSLQGAVAVAPAEADATHSVIVKLIGDGQMQVTSPDDATEIDVNGQFSHMFVQSNRPTIATAPCVAQASFPFTVVCPFDQVKSVLVLAFAGDDVVRTFLEAQPVTVITGDGNDTVIDNSLNLNTVLHDLFLLGDGDDRAAFGNSTGVANDVFGGPGRDEVEYGNTLSVAISLDDLANDGPLDEQGPLPAFLNDNIRSDVEDITGGNAADILIGSDSNNLIIGGGDTDTIRGLGGDDTLNGDGDVNSANTDLIDGGTGTDTVSYAERSAPVNVSLDGLANDGTTGELDNVINTENLIGGGGNDTLTGNAGPNFIRGLGGNDQLRGLAGNDLLLGDTGSDIADGGAGSDLCQAEHVLSCP